MVKVVSTCLWGKDARYNIGAIRNAELTVKYYPDYEFWIYIHKETVPEKIINELRKIKNVKIIIKTGDLSKCLPMTWRFEAIDDPNVELMLCRDLDTRILKREVVIVNKWIKSGKTFHIIRDHPHHTGLVFGGMFGTKKIKNIPSWKNLLEKTNQIGDRMYDVKFLETCIYPVIKDDCVVHSNFNRYELQSEYIHVKYNENHDFIGEYVYHDESRSKRHKDILINHLRENKLNL